MNVNLGKIEILWIGKSIDLDVLNCPWMGLHSPFKDQIWSWRCCWVCYLPGFISAWWGTDRVCGLECLLPAQACMSAVSLSGAARYGPNTYYFQAVLEKQPHLHFRGRTRCASSANLQRAARRLREAPFYPEIIENISVTQISVLILQRKYENVCVWTV